MKIEVHSAIKAIGTALLLCLSLAISGCDQDGPMENAGEEIDDAVEEAGDSAEEAADEVEEEIDDATSS